MEEVIVRRLRLSPARLPAELSVRAMLCWLRKLVLRAEALGAITILYEMVVIDRTL